MCGPQFVAPKCPIANTGSDKSLPLKRKSRKDQLTLLVLQAGINLGRAEIGEYVAGIVDIFVQLVRRDGRRTVSQITIRGHGQKHQCQTGMENATRSGPADPDGIGNKLLAGTLSLHRIGVAPMLKSLIRSQAASFERKAARFGYRLNWTPQVIIDEPDSELGFDLEFVLAHLMLRKKDIFFIQIGANDGITCDPLHKFVTEFGWSGILIEPMPGAFARLQKTHHGNGKLKLVNAALSHQDGSRPLYTVRMDADTFQRADMYSSFDKNVVLRNSRFVPDIADRIVELEVPCISVNTLLKEIGDRTVDVLTIDTEGFDYEILKMIDFAQWKPAVICYEHTHLNRSDMQAAASLLAKQGYRMTRDNLDTIAYRQAFSFGWRQPHSAG